MTARVQRPQPLHCPMERLIVEQRRGLKPNLRKAVELPWRQPKLTIALGDCSLVQLTSDVSESDVSAVVERAIATWNAIGLPIELEFVGSSSVDWQAGFQPDVLVAWYSSQGDPESMFAGTAHAHADYPPGNTLFGGPPLPLHFNASVPWGIGVAGCFDIETIALHELAHLLGLVYHSGPNTILFDAIPPAPTGIRHHLDPATITRAHLLYGDTAH